MIIPSCKNRNRIYRKMDSPSLERTIINDILFNLLVYMYYSVFVVVVFFLFIVYSLCFISYLVVYIPTNL